jgi:hypothetical protein
MISIVICHRDADFLRKILKNVEDTIGVLYELHIIDNSKGAYTIFEAYNLGVSKSKFDIICFTHEDILFHTKNWGQFVVDHFKDDSIGMIGICGGDAMPCVPAPWWNSKTQNHHYFNNINTWKGKESYHQYSNPFKEEVSNVVLLDGAWFCISKSLFEKVTFDTATFTGFHCYDSDISLQVLEYKRVVVVYNILLEHFSAGSINKDWAKSAELLADKWQEKLPVIKRVQDKEIVNLYNYQSLLTYAYWIQELHLRDKEIRKIIKKYLKKIDPLNPFYKDSSLLYLWSIFGYNIARVLHKPFKLILKK